MDGSGVVSWPAVGDHPCRSRQSDQDDRCPVQRSAANSGGSNLGPTSAVLVERLAINRQALDQAEPRLAGKPIPADTLTTSASALDPEISPAYAALQTRRVAAARGLAEERISALLARHIVGRTLGIFGEPRVNVLELNRIQTTPSQRSLGIERWNVLAVRMISYQPRGRREAIRDRARSHNGAAF
jgi:K+-transporting ATPase KdpC subunit